MRAYEIIMFLFNIVMNTLKRIFKPEPDMRFKLFIEDGKVKNSVDGFNLFPVQINPIYSLEIMQNGKTINLLYMNHDGKNYVIGLPIISYGETTIKLIDNTTDDIIKEVKLNNGHFISYSDIFGAKLFIT